MLWSLGLVAILADLSFRQWGGDFDLASDITDEEKLNRTTGVNAEILRIYLINNTLIDHDNTRTTSLSKGTTLKFYENPTTHYTESEIIFTSPLPEDYESKPSGRDISGVPGGDANIRGERDDRKILKNGKETQVLLLLKVCGDLKNLLLQN
ncbi:hypothetical protein Ocin01_17845 [Orchesella cincta]|uniref:Uncharacterized protein n=1 Tax=Orchesella cincta TaxID=48709 RepID=A0A1D2M799_ORCCI|nr:hypothetical protein Ocin01_17845 [Orchesella cincta]